MIAAHANLRAAYAKAPPADKGEFIYEMERTFDAARAAARAYPKTLIAVGRQRLSSEEARTIGWLVIELPPSVARQTWAGIERTIETIPKEEFSRLARKRVLLFADRRLTARIEKAAVHDGFSFEALSVIAPEKAIRVLDRAGGEDLLQAVHHLDLLVRAHPGVDDRLVGRLADKELDSDSLCFRMGAWAACTGGPLWSALTRKIAKQRLGPKRSRVLDQLAHAPSLILIDHLRANRGRPLESRVERIAAARLAKKTGRYADHELDAADDVLLRIGGRGFDRMVVSRLQHGDEIEQRHGIRDALIADAPTVRQALMEYANQLFSRNKRGRVPMEPFEVLALVDPRHAGVFARRCLGTRRVDAVWLAGETALVTGDKALGQMALARLAASRAADNPRLELNLLARFAKDIDRQRKIARRALGRGDSLGRTLAAWVGRRLEDDDLLADVEEALVSHVQSTADPRDAYTLGVLSAHPICGPRLLDRLRHDPSMKLLRHLLADSDIDAAWVRDPLVADRAIDAAFQFESSFLNTPKDGQERLWQIDIEIAFEAFDEGLRRGGRASEGLAATAVRIDASRAAAIILKRLPNISHEKVRTDLCRALRGIADRSWLEAQVVAMLMDEDEQCRIAAIEIAGWLGTRALDQHILSIRRGDTRSSVQKAAHVATSRSDRLQTVAALVERIRTEKSPRNRRRLLAIATDMDVAHVLRARDDPLHIGQVVRNSRELKLVNIRMRQ